MAGRGHKGRDYGSIFQSAQEDAIALAM